MTVVAITSQKFQCFSKMIDILQQRHLSPRQNHPRLGSSGVKRLVSLIVVVGALSFTLNVQTSLILNTSDADTSILLHQRRLKEHEHSAINGTGAFVHLEKTGGSTLSLLLRNGCHSYMPKPCREVVGKESAASKRVESYYHGESDIDGVLGTPGIAFSSCN